MASASLVRKASHQACSSCRTAFSSSELTAAGTVGDEGAAAQALRVARHSRADRLWLRIGDSLAAVGAGWILRWGCTGFEGGASIVWITGTSSPRDQDAQNWVPACAGT